MRFQRKHFCFKSLLEPSYFAFRQGLYGRFYNHFKLLSFQAPTCEKFGRTLSNIPQRGSEGHDGIIFKSSLEIHRCLLLTFLTLTTATDAIAATMDNNPPRSIQVQGVGKVSVAPDLASLVLNVDVHAKTAEAARQQAAVVMDKLIKAVKDNGVDSKDIQTRSLSLFPNYSTEAPGKITDYQFDNQVEVAIHNLADTSRIIDEAVKAGGNATRIQGIAFSLADPQSALAGAREQAFANAKTKAEEYAKMAGVTLDAPLTISEAGDNTNNPVVFSDTLNLRSVIADRVATPVEPGRQELSVTITVIFGIH